MNNMENNTEYLTYTEFINILNLEIQEIIKKSSKANKLYKLLESFSVVGFSLTEYFFKTLKKITPLATGIFSFSALFLPATDPTFISHLTTPFLVGIPLYLLLSSKRLADKMEDFAYFKLVSFEDNKNFHDATIQTTISKQNNLNPNIPEFHDEIFTFEQLNKKIFTRDDIRKFLKLLDNFSILAINFSITMDNLNSLLNIDPKENEEIIYKINKLAATQFNSFHGALKKIKKEKRNEFNLQMNNFPPITNLQYDLNNNNKKKNRKNLTYIEMISKICERISKEITIHQKEIGKYNHQISQYKLALQMTQDQSRHNQLLNDINNKYHLIFSTTQQINSLAIKQQNLNNWFFICNNLMKSEEKVIQIPESINDTIYNLLNYYDISTITLCLFEKKLGILSDYCYNPQYRYKLCMISHNILSSYLSDKSTHQIYFQESYESFFKKISDQKSL